MQNERGLIVETYTTDLIHGELPEWGTPDLVSMSFVKPGSAFAMHAIHLDVPCCFPHKEWVAEILDEVVPHGLGNTCPVAHNPYGNRSDYGEAIVLAHSWNPSTILPPPHPKGSENPD